MKYVGFLGVAVLTFFLVACDNRGYGGYMGGWGHMMPYGYGGVFMWIIFLVILVAVIYVISKGGYASGKSTPRDETPLDILQKRYAKGDITKDQFEQMKKDMGL